MDRYREAPRSDVLKVVVDLRSSSLTPRLQVGAELSGELAKSVARGFMALEESAGSFREPTTSRAISPKRAIRCNDPTVRIRWLVNGLTVVPSTSDGLALDLESTLVPS